MPLLVLLHARRVELLGHYVQVQHVQTWHRVEAPSEGSGAGDLSLCELCRYCPVYPAHV